MQTDPIGYEDQINLYAYVGNDPMNSVDPTGMYQMMPNAAMYQLYGVNGTQKLIMADAKGTLIGSAVVAGVVAQGMLGAVVGAEGAVITTTVAESSSGDAPVGIAGNTAKSATPNAAQSKNISRFESKIPANAKGNIETHALPSDGVAVQAKSSGQVPGSSAVYEKQIDASGTTTQYTKTTYDPDGNIVHVKDKINNETYYP